MVDESWSPHLQIMFKKFFDILLGYSVLYSRVYVLNQNVLSVVNEIRYFWGSVDQPSWLELQWPLLCALLAEMLIDIKPKE